MNLFIGVGNLTRDPETSVAKTGTAFSKLGVAINSGFGDKAEVLFIDATFFGKTAEFCEKNLKKGSPVLIRGRIKTESWEDKNTGEKKYKTVVIGETLESLRRNSSSSSDSSDDGSVSIKSFDADEMPF